jgi:hypothetical protein
MVICILADTKNAGLRNPPAPAVYLPYTVIAPTGRTLAVRTQGSPMLLLNAVRQQVLQVDKDQPVSRPITLQEIVGSETDQPRFNMALFTSSECWDWCWPWPGIFSALLYGGAPTHEIGVQALPSADVLRLMFRMGGRLVLAGLAADWRAARSRTRSEVFQVPVTDWVALVAVVTLLCAAAFFACLLPARRAARLDPMVALRHE